MLAINTNSNYFIENQPSVAKELLVSLKKLFNDFIGEKIANQRFENLKKDFMFLTNEAHRLNAEIEIIRDFIDNYYINDASSDEKILNKYSTMLDKLSSKIENILEVIEDSKINNPMLSTLFTTYDDLYSNIVNTNFAISQKITMAYFDSKSDISVLQEA
ncbi:hypothetical protein [Aliarcobacter skirrowii]|uniref:Chemotaxis protein n=1 Tax=Aliarcobacter skirrowii TaxID=28200 RepID=A0AAW9DA25_9BACT|nr:hypothetical protein [Aliarcobacter skirrowii]MDX4069128.1 hypothetical protein [Aliarcobacter skirrowii]